jgi:hypothetical protein
MGFDKNQQFVPGSRTIAAGVSLVEHAFSASTLAALKSLNAGLRVDGQRAYVSANKSSWVFSASSTAADTTDNFVLTPDVGLGRWLRTDPSVHMKLAVAFGTADAATLFTVPAGVRLELEKLFWEITADWTGGSSSAIGVSSADAPHSTKGDLLGGATGDVLATLVATTGETQGTVGVSFSSAPNLAVLEATDTIRFDRITSAFTAGTGFVHVIARQIN